MNSACVRDTWSCVLFSVEMFLNLLYLPLTGLLFYSFCTQRNLHINFRSLLLLVSIGNLFSTIQRIILVTARLCCIGSELTEIVFALAPLQYMGAFIGLFGWMSIVGERAVASMISATYEHQCKSPFFPIVLWGANGLLTALLTFIKIKGILQYFDYYLLGFQIISVATDLLGLLVIVHHNCAVYKTRHMTMMQLTDRYQVDEIIRATKYVLPAAVCDLVAKVIYLFLFLYSIFYTNIPIGQDTGHISHAYDITGAAARVFFGAVMVLRSEKFDFLLKRVKRSNQVVANEANLASNHFDELREMWA